MAQNGVRLAGGVIAAIVVALGLVALLPRLVPQTAVTEASDDAVPQQAPATTGAPASAAPAAAETEAANVAEAAPADAAEAAPDAEPDAGPVVDTFLLGPDGVAVIAGQAVPGARIAVQLDGAEVATVTADAGGAFAVTAQIAAADVPRSLTFSVDGAAPAGDIVLVQPGTGAPAAEPVVTADAGAAVAGDAGGAPGAAGDDAAAGAEDSAAVTGAPQGQAAATDAEATTPVAPLSATDPLAADAVEADQTADAAGAATATGDGAAATDKADAAATVPDAPAADAPVAGDDAAREADAAAAQPAAPDAARTAATRDTQADTAAEAAQPADDTPPAPTIVVDAEGARVVAGPEGVDALALDAITYDAEGGVLLAGRATDQGSVQVYLDNAPLATGPIGQGGDWRLTLPAVDPGTYTLRVDQLSADGRVISRVETPFRREVAADMAALARNEADLRVVTAVVQPGSTLWAIARDAFGDGMMYVAVFEANAGQIRDPDLIYPGQVFVVPDAQDAVARP